MLMYKSRLSSFIYVDLWITTFIITFISGVVYVIKRGQDASILVLPVIVVAALVAYIVHNVCTAIASRLTRLYDIFEYCRIPLSCYFDDTHTLIIVKPDSTAHIMVYNEIALEIEKFTVYMYNKVKNTKDIRRILAKQQLLELQAAVVLLS